MVIFERFLWLMRVLLGIPCSLPKEIHYRLKTKTLTGHKKMFRIKDMAIREKLTKGLDMQILFTKLLCGIDIWITTYI